MAFKTDIEIAREAKKKPIMEIGNKLGIPAEHLLPYGHDKAKVSQDFISSLQGKKDGKLILVTAINPTPAGEGKTTTTVGLGDGLNRIGKKAVICIREASLGKMSAVLAYDPEPKVSIDFNHTPQSCIFAPDQTKVVGGRTVRVLAWYDNEWGYSCRVVDLAIKLF